MMNVQMVIRATWLLAMLVLMNVSVTHAIRFDFHGLSDQGLPAHAYFSFRDELLLPPEQVTMVSWSQDLSSDVMDAAVTFQYMRRSNIGPSFVDTVALSSLNLVRANFGIQNGTPIFADVSWHENGGSQFRIDPNVFYTNEFVPFLGVPPDPPELVFVGSWSSLPPLQSVPEPSTLLLFGTGLLGGACWGLNRDRKRRAAVQ